MPEILQHRRQQRIEILVAGGVAGIAARFRILRLQFLHRAIELVGRAAHDADARAGVLEAMRDVIADAAGAADDKRVQALQREILHFKKFRGMESGQQKPTDFR